VQALKEAPGPSPTFLCGWMDTQYSQFELKLNKKILMFSVLFCSRRLAAAWRSISRYVSAPVSTAAFMSAAQEADKAARVIASRGSA